jgi:DNA-binding transcriptional LysR family regulator
MDPNHLRIFLAVAGELHFGRAADRLLLAQPYVSRAVKNLEKDLGVTLFERSTRRVTLTSAGMALVGPAEAILATGADARREVKRAQRGESGRVRISFAGPSSHALIGRLGRLMGEQHPGIDLQFNPGRFGLEVFDQLVGGSIDLAIARFRNVPDEVSVRPIATERYVMAVPSTHRLAGTEKASLAEFRNDGFITLPSGSAVHTDFMEWCQAAGFDPKVVQHAPDSWTIMALVSAGAGVTFTVDTALEHVSTEGIHAVHLDEDQAPVFAYLAWRRDSTNAALRVLLEASESLFPTPRAAVDLAVKGRPRRG